MVINGFCWRAQGKVRVGPESAALSFHWRAQRKVCVGLGSAALTRATAVTIAMSMLNIRMILTAMTRYDGNESNDVDDTSFNADNYDQCFILPSLETKDHTSLASVFWICW